MGFLENLFNVILAFGEKTQNDYSKGYDKADDLTSEQIKERIKDPHRSPAEKAGMAQAYKDSHESE